MTHLPAAALLASSLLGAVPAIAIAAPAAVAQAATTAPATAELQSSVTAWRAQRLASLKNENGWLSLVALLPLRPGIHTLGSAKSSSLRLAHADVPARAARITVQGGTVTLVAEGSSGITLAGKPVKRLALASDASGEPTVLALGSLRFFVIDRVGHLFLRVRDTKNPKVAAFQGIDSYPVRDEWNISARFETYVPAHQVTIVNILGLEQQMPSPGAIVFEKNGQSWRLDTLDEDPSSDELTVMFADGTSGSETYGAGRFLEVPRPQSGRIQVDFNKAYNPPCAFSEFATCPLPPPQNKIGLRVEAGELRYRH